MKACAASAGVVSTAQLASLGVGDHALRRLVATGALVRESRGVYRLAAYRLGFEQRLQIARRTGATFSHETAGCLWGWDRFADSAIHITVRRGRLVSVPSWVKIHESRQDLKASTVERRGATVTTPLRTALDLGARPISEDEYRQFLNHCLVDRLFTIRSLERYALENAWHARGVKRLRAAITELCEIDSVAEAELVRALRKAGLAPPATQFELRDGGRFVARIDLAWPAQRVALELDGYRHHSDLRSFVHDRERGNRIVALGWALLRTTPSAVRARPDVVVSDVKAALRRSTAA